MAMMSTTTEPKQAAHFHVATKPFTVVDAINRVAIATGSVRQAIVTESASPVIATGWNAYNGHHITVEWNAYRGYYVAEYYWGQRNVLCRGSAIDCVLAAITEWKRQGLGSKVTLTIKAEDVEAVQDATNRLTTDPVPVMVQEGDEQWPPSWWSWKHDEVAGAVNLERQLGCPFTRYLADPMVVTRADYNAKVNAFFATRHAQ